MLLQRSLSTDRVFWAGAVRNSRLKRCGSCRAYTCSIPHSSIKPDNRPLRGPQVEVVALVVEVLVDVVELVALVAVAVAVAVEVVVVVVVVVLLPVVVVVEVEVEVVEEAAVVVVAVAVAVKVRWKAGAILVVLELLLALG